jgi:hypothetical protein
MLYIIVPLSIIPIMLSFLFFLAAEKQYSTGLSAVASSSHTRMKRAPCSRGAPVVGHSLGKTKPTTALHTAMAHVQQGKICIYSFFPLSLRNQDPWSKMKHCH